MTPCILVTGASRGIGAALVRELDANQCIGTSRHQATPSAAKMRWIQVDFAAQDAAQRVVQALVKDETTLSGLVLCAGVALPEDFTRGQVCGQHLQVNLQAPLSLVSALLEAKRLRKGASIVFVGSNLARRGLAGKVSYSAAKAGLEGAVRALVHELAPHKIRVNVVAPGLVNTDMTQGMEPSARAAYCKNHPAGRMAEPKDIAPVLRFFLSEDSAYVNGQVLDVDGGWAA